MLKKMVVLILCCTMLSACNVNTKENSKDTSSEVEISQEQRRINKENVYVELNNFITGRYFTDIIDRYFIMFGTEEFVKPSGAPFVNTVAQHEVELIEKALECSKSEPKIEGFDAAVQDLIPKMQKLINVMNEAHTYYNQKDYVDDNYAKGAEYHNQIIEIYFNEFYPSLKVFLNNMEEMGERKRKEDMKNMKDHDFMIQYHMLDILCKAQDIQNEMYNQGIDSSNILKLNIVPVKEKYQLLIESIGKLREYGKDNSRLEKEGFVAAQIEQYLKDAGNVKASVTEIIQRVEKKEPIDAFDIQHGYVTSRSGTPENFDSKLGDLIDYYNRSITR
ncbi:DUF3829 domain-containing protein [Inediibacterium massiliense]|uniref:DUF3829 domain-containing protein n=1 Tax=Inediibacterium massiliense TaxID=1658111 RepID=UPI0006B4862A|nr:DUF3829 domain-containing protein [Inediibacterium massiliense]